MKGGKIGIIRQLLQVIKWKKPEDQIKLVKYFNYRTFEKKHSLLSFSTCMQQGYCAIANLREFGKIYIYVMMYPKHKLVVMNYLPVVFTTLHRILKSLSTRSVCFLTMSLSPPPSKKKTFGEKQTFNSRVIFI